MDELKAAQSPIAFRAILVSSECLEKPVDLSFGELSPLRMSREELLKAVFGGFLGVFFRQPALIRDQDPEPQITREAFSSPGRALGPAEQHQCFGEWHDFGGAVAAGQNQPAPDELGGVGLAIEQFFQWERLGGWHELIPFDGASSLCARRYSSTS